MLRVESPQQSDQQQSDSEQRQIDLLQIPHCGPAGALL